MNIHDVQASKSEVENALQCILDGDSMSDTAKIVGKSRRTIQNWSDAGLLTDGKKWTNLRREHDTLAAVTEEGKKLEVQVEEKKDWQQDVASNLRSAIEKGVRNIANGDVDLDAKDIETLEKVERRIGNRAEEVQALINRYTRKWLEAMRQELDHQTFETLVSKKKQLEREALEEIEPEGAQEMVENTSIEEESYNK